MTSHCSLGFRVKSGRAIAIALTGPASEPVPLARTIVELSDRRVDATKQPFHAGFGKAQQDSTVIARLVAIIERCARQSIAELLADERLRGHACRRAGIVVGSLIDPDQVGNPHIRAHANEGRLFRTVVEDALRSHRVACTIVVEKELANTAAAKLGQSNPMIKRTADRFGSVLGRPWGADEKAAAIGAWLVL